MKRYIIKELGCFIGLSLMSLSALATVFDVPATGTGPYQFSESMAFGSPPVSVPHTVSKALWQGTHSIPSSQCSFSVDQYRVKIPANTIGNGEFSGRAYSARGRLRAMVAARRYKNSNLVWIALNGSRPAVREGDYYAVMVPLSDAYRFELDGGGQAVCAADLKITFIAHPFADTDGDGVTDLIEFHEGSDADDANSFSDIDGDGIADALDADTDGDGVDNIAETGGLDPYADTDGDGLPAYLDGDPAVAGDPSDAVRNPDFFSRSVGVAYFKDAAVISADDAVRVYVRSGRGNGDGQSWTTAFGSLDEALARATKVGDEIWLASGVYVPMDVTNGFKIPAGVVIRGGFAGESSETSASDALPSLFITVLSGDTGGDDKTVQGVVQNISDIEGDNVDTVVTIKDTKLNGNSRTELTGLTITASAVRGVIVNNSNVLLEHVVIQGNRGAIGAGVYATNHSDVVINDTAIVNNAEIRDQEADWKRGGGLGVLGGSKVLVNRSLIAHNQAVDSAGGIIVEGGSELIMANSTVTGNKAQWGGGIQISSGSTFSCVQCSVVNNSTTVASAVSKNIYSGDADTTINLERSFIANTERNNQGGWDIYSKGVVNNGGYNVIGSDGVAGLYENGMNGCRYAIPGGSQSIWCTGYEDLWAAFFTAAGSNSFISLQPIDTMINSTLSSNGGVTRTLPVREGSTLIDNIPSAACGNTAFANVPGVSPITIDNATDQRGYDRQFGDQCDIGAVEYTDVDGKCFDDGALTRSKSAFSSGAAFCAGSSGSNLQELINNFSLGSSSPLLLLLLILPIIWRLAKAIRRA